MDRTGQLMDIYKLSGLEKFLATNGHRYDATRDFSKLKFVRNGFRMRLELWDPKRGDSYFRVHHGDTAPAWLPEALRELPGMRHSAAFGANFDGDPLATALALATSLYFAD